MARRPLAWAQALLVLGRVAAAVSASASSGLHSRLKLSHVPRTVVDHARGTPGQSFSVANGLFTELWRDDSLPHPPLNESLGVDVEPPPTIDVHSLEGNSLSNIRGIAAYVVAPVTGVFLVAVIVSSAMEHIKGFRMIPESAWIVLVAVSMGFLVREMMASGAVSMHGYSVMNAGVLNLGLLPIIIFTSGWMLRRRDFASQFHIILIYAVLGTVLSTVMIGLGVGNFVHYLGFQLTMRESFVFAALISAVDPVATLATYSKLGIEEKQPLLNTLVFGESVINDAVAIVLFGLFNEHPPSDVDFMSTCSEVMRLLFGSIFFGILVAGILIFLLRIAKLPGETKGEICYIFMSAYFIFCLSESLHFSGIISTLFAGILFRRYGAHHLTPKGRATTVTVLNHGAYKADTAVFLLCGASTALLSSARAFWFGCFATLLCLVVRAFTVSGCSVIANAVKRLYEDEHVVTWRHQVMLWHSGLRGGIALVLALEINGEWCAHKATIIDGTFVVICALLLTCGSTTEILVEALGFTEVAEGEVDAEGNDISKFSATMTSAPHQLRRRKQKEAEEEEEEVSCMEKFNLYVHRMLFFCLVSSDAPLETNVEASMAIPKAASMEYTDLVSETSSKRLIGDSP